MRKRSVIVKTVFIILLLWNGNVQAGKSPEAPENLRPAAGQVVSLEVRANGVQIYECKASADDAKRFEWVFKAPEADLFDDTGAKVGRHYAGPTWEANDGSKVVGEMKARGDSPDPGAIPWLLLTAKATSGDGVLSRTKSIQRLSTVGGKAPAEECIAAMAGKETRVPYKAVYYFYVEGQ